MNLTSRMARRVTGTVAAACAAILIPTVALAALGHPAGAAAVAPKCAASQLEAWIALPGTGAAGTSSYWLEISNLSHRTCALKGFPGVSAIGPHGQLGSPAGRDHRFRSRLITLHRGGTAHFAVNIGNVSGLAPGTCHPVKAEGLRIFPPNDRRSVTVTFTLETCKKRGSSNLGVTTMLRGTGIPLFNL